MRPKFNDRPIMVAVTLLAAGTFALGVRAEGENKTGPPQTRSSIGPKTAPDRRLRRPQPAAAPSNNDQQAGLSSTDGFLNTSSAGSSNSSGGTTTVSLQGAVTRLDGSANSTGNFKQMPLSGKIESLIETPLQSQKPRSEQIPPQMFKAWLESAHPQFALSASNNPDNSVVVLKGQWDDSSKTLKKFEIPHVKMGGGKFVNFPLNETKVLIVDCAGDLPNAARQKLRDFVMRGGYLLSTDWSLDNSIGPAFTDRSGREYIQWNKGVNRRDVVNATVYDADPVLFNHAVTNAHWKLDQDSHLIKILNKDAVRVLATSSELVADDPDRAGILACVFSFGRGYVMHMTGHFDNNAKLAIGNFLPDPAPVIKISLRQALAANFVVAGLTGTRIPSDRRR